MRTDTATRSRRVGERTTRRLHSKLLEKRRELVLALGTCRACGDRSLNAIGMDVLHQIDLALDRIHDGTYGTCQDCGGPIATARLRVLPYASLCVACKQQREVLMGEANGCHGAS